MALAMILAEPPSPRRKLALILFFVQLALNFAWSPIFFAGHDIRLAKVVIFAHGGRLRPRPPGSSCGSARPPGCCWFPIWPGWCSRRRSTATIEQLNPGAGTSLLGSDNLGISQAIGDSPGPGWRKRPQPLFPRRKGGTCRCSPRTGCSTIS